jgi:hypothetical protein
VAKGTAVVLTTDGVLHLIDPRTSSERAKVAVVDAFGTTGARPSLAVGVASDYATDPSIGQVSQIRLADLRITARIPVSGQPSSVAVIEP